MIPLTRFARHLHQLLTLTLVLKLLTQWNQPLGTPTTVTFDITGSDDGTDVRVTESGYPDTPDGRWHIMDCAVEWGRQ